MRQKKGVGNFFIIFWCEQYIIDIFMNIRLVKGVRTRTVCATKVLLSTNNFILL